MYIGARLVIIHYRAMQHVHTGLHNSVACRPLRNCSTFSSHLVSALLINAQGLD